MGVLLREWLGFNMKVIQGYTDSGVLFLAIERGEVEGRTVGLSSVRANKPDWLKPNGLGRVMVVFGRSSRLSDYPDVPMARELAKSAAAKATADALPTAEHRTLDGQTHDVAPEALAPVLVEFFGG